MRRGKRYAWVVLIGLVHLAVWGSDLRPVQAQTSCLFTPFADTLLYHAPILDPAQQKDILPTGRAYNVQSQAPTYLYVTIDDAYGGFVDRQAGSLSGDCGMAVPTDSRPLHTYLTVCIIEIGPSALPVYENDQLQKQTGVTQSNATYAVTKRTATGNYLYKMGWTAANLGHLKGNCQILQNPAGTTAMALGNAHIWSAPNVHLGQQLATLSMGTQVRIIAGPVRGFIRLDSQVEGNWYQIQTTGAPEGWVWSERLALSGARWRASAREDARIWSAPDAKTGQFVCSIAPGQEVLILSGPVRGNIRLDSDAQGNWYLVQTTDFSVTGWMWDNRLTVTP